MNAAWWTLAGVGAAAAFSLGKDWLLEDRRTALQRRKEREDELRAARVAALLIADELDTHAMNYRLLARLGRTPKRQVTQTANFLGSTEWEAHKLDIACLTIIPPETWKGLTHAYHNAKQLRSRVELDGPDVGFPPSRIPTLNEHGDSAEELASILTDAAQSIGEIMRPRARHRWRRFGTRSFRHGLGTEPAEIEDADERT
jgi:hypothetical protein